MEVIFCPEATRAEVAALYPGAVTCQSWSPIHDPGGRARASVRRRRGRRPASGMGRYRTQDEAQAACAALLRHGLVARIVYGPEVIDAVTAGADE